MSEEKDEFQTPSQIKNEELGTEIDSIDLDKIKKEEVIERIYDIEGLLMGGATGLVIGIIISFNIIFAMEIGMFIGLIVGTRLKKKKKNKNT